MHHAVDLLLKPRFQQLILIAILLAVSSLVCGKEGLPTLASIDEPREVAGYIIAAIIFNLTLVSVILVLLRREWNKHKVIPKPTSNDKREGK